MMQTVTRRHICFVSIVEGDLETQYRGRCESALFERLASARIDMSMVSLHDGGCAFAVDEHAVATVRKAMDSLNVALSVRAHCARVSLEHHAVDLSFLYVSWIIAAMAKAEIEIVHLSAGAADVAVLVGARDATRAQAVVAGCAAALTRNGV